MRHPNRNRLGRPRHAIWSVAVLALSTASCSSGEPDRGALAAAEAAVRLANIAQWPELSGLESLAGPPTWRSTFGPARCDAQPDIDVQQICGRGVPSSIHFAWDGCDDFDLAAKGADPVPPPSGTVDLQSSWSSDADDPCVAGALWQVERNASAHLERSGPGGRQMVVDGSTTMVGQPALPGEPFGGDLQVSTARRIVDANGNELRRMQMSGDLTVAITGKVDAPLRTISGTVDVTAPGGKSVQLVLAGASLAAPEACRWPIAGTLTGALTGQTHIIAFGPSCGEATLNGDLIHLTEASARFRGGWQQR